jgi:hypothetical protein
MDYRRTAGTIHEWWNWAYDIVSGASDLVFKWLQIVALVLLIAVLAQLRACMKPQQLPFDLQTPVAPPPPTKGL